MFLRLRFAAAGMACLIAPPPAGAADRDRDFTGVWLLDSKQSDYRGLTQPPAAVLKITQQGLTIRSEESGSSGVRGNLWVYQTDGSESRFKIGDDRMNSEAKWEGAAFLINTIVTGAHNYVVSDRWRVSGDRRALTIRRQIQTGSSNVEAVLVYRNQAATEAAPDTRPTLEPASPELRVPAPEPSAPQTPSAPPAPIVIPAGTRISLALVNSLSTRGASEGDRVYLQTAFPVTINGRIVIPRGSYVAGTVTEVKRPGRVKGKGELFLRFDSLTLPNGVNRDFRSRVGGMDADAGALDRKEGKIKGEGNKSGDGRTVAETTTVGAGVGGIAGSAAGHAGMGVGIGAAVGAAAGLAHLLLSRGPDLVLPKGTTFEMVLDRALQFQPAEIQF